MSVEIPSCIKLSEESYIIGMTLFCNRLGIGLCDYQRTGEKPPYVNSMCSTLEGMLNKFLNWTVWDDQYSPFVNKLLNTHGANQIFRECLGESYYKEARIITNKSKNIRKMDKPTESTNKSIDYLIDFLINLSNKGLCFYL